MTIRHKTVAGDVYIASADLDKHIKFFGTSGKGKCLMSNQTERPPGLFERWLEIERGQDKSMVRILADLNLIRI